MVKQPENGYKNALEIAGKGIILNHVIEDHKLFYISVIFQCNPTEIYKALI